MGSASNRQFRKWAQGIRISDEQAFEELFQAMYPPLLKFAWRYTGDKHSAQDVVQESFVKLWEIRSNIDPGNSLKAYVYQIVRNRALNYIRDEKEHTPLDTLHPQKMETNNEEISKPDRVPDYHKKMAELIAELPDRQCEAMQLSRFEGLEHEEIAEVMQISPRTVNNHIVSALKTLRKEWNAYKQNQNGGYHE